MKRLAVDDRNERPVQALCPACGCAETRCLGALPEPRFVYPDCVDAELKRGWFFLCPRCTLRFRSPMQPPWVLLRRYQGMKENRFRSNNIREVWSHVRRIAGKSQRRSILDVGCFKGDMLLWMGSAWQRYGIELSGSASKSASEAGIIMIGSNVDDEIEFPADLGAICLIDVLEHLPRPFEILKRLAKALAPSGRMLIFTGDTESWTWRFGGRHYWYSALPEHLTFFSRSWFRWAAPQIGCVLRETIQLAHQPAPTSQRVREAIQNIVYILFRRFEAAAGYAGLMNMPGLRRLSRHNIAWWTSARDHILVELERIL